MTKRWRTPTAKPGQLKVAYGKEPGDEPDLQFCYGGEGADRRDNNMLMLFFHQVKNQNGMSLVEELTSRGYDISTLKFSIEKLQK